MKRELNRLNAGYFYGTVLRSCATTEFTLTETAYSSGVKLPEHAHERAYFCFVLQGCFAESYGSQSHECHATTLIFHPRGEMHSDYFHTAARCFNLQIDSKLTDRLQLQTPMMDCLAHFRGGLLAQLAARLYREFRGMDELSPLVVEALTLEMVVEAFRHSSRQQKGGPPRWLNRARKLLDDDFREPHTLSEISAYAQVHPAHLARDFRRRQGCTVGEYIRRRRIEFACDRISRSNASLSQIALEAGFSHQSHFSVTFKRVIGMTPDEYRRIFTHANHA